MSKKPKKNYIVIRELEIRINNGVFLKCRLFSDEYFVFNEKNDYIKDLQKTIEDKEEAENYLKSDLGDDYLRIRRSLLPYLNDLRIKEDYLYGQIQFLLKNYLIKNGKPFTVSKKTHEFLQSQGFAKGGKVNYEYIPKYEIESINTWDGENIEEKDILDGAYVKRKRKR
jgi:hypothetical protein